MPFHENELRGQESVTSYIYPCSLFFSPFYSLPCTLADRVGVIYADTLMVLYETIARELHKYLEVVDSYYGKVRERKGGEGRWMIIVICALLAL